MTVMAAILLASFNPAEDRSESRADYRFRNSTRIAAQVKSSS